MFSSDGKDPLFVKHPAQLLRNMDEASESSNSLRLLELYALKDIQPVLPLRAAHTASIRFTGLLVFRDNHSSLVCTGTDQRTRLSSFLEEMMHHFLQRLPDQPVLRISGNAFDIRRDHCLSFRAD